MVVLGVARALLKQFNFTQRQLKKAKKAGIKDLMYFTVVNRR